MLDDNIIIRGNLVEDLSLNHTRSEPPTPVVNMRVARNFAPRPDGTRPDTIFFQVEVWNELAENIQHLRKGARVIVTGRIITKSRTVDGHTYHDMVVRADDVGVSARWNPVFSGYQPVDSSDPLTEEDLSDEDETF